MLDTIVRVNGATNSGDVLARAVAVLAAGGLLVYPTDTLYALGCRARDVDACARVRRAKGREDGKPFPLVAGDTAAVEALGNLPDGGRRLALRFWPGPLTLVLEAAAGLPGEVTAGTGTVAVRVPALPLTRALCLAAGPLVSTSANRAGLAPARTCAEAVAALGDQVAMALDAGPGRDRPSTIVDLTGGAPRLLRAGAVAWVDVLAAWTSR